MLWTEVASALEGLRAITLNLPEGTRRSVTWVPATTVAKEGPPFLFGCEWTLGWKCTKIGPCLIDDPCAGTDMLRRLVEWQIRF